MRIIMSLLVALFILGFAVTTYADHQVQLRFEWIKNTEADIAGYKLYESDVLHDFDVSKLVVDSIPHEFNANERQEYIYTYTVGEEAIGTKYFVMTAYDVHGAESGYSNEVYDEYNFNQPPQPPQDLNIIERIVLAVVNFFKSLFASNTLTVSKG